MTLLDELRKEALEGSHTTEYHLATNIALLELENTLLRLRIKKMEKVIEDQRPIRRFVPAIIAGADVDRQ